jgi:hypothetical protein
MKQSSLSRRMEAANHLKNSAMEADTISKHGRSLKSHMSRKNHFKTQFLIFLISLLSIVSTITTTNAQIVGGFKSKEGYIAFFKASSDMYVPSILMYQEPGKQDHTTAYLGIPSIKSGFMEYRSNDGHVVQGYMESGQLKVLTPSGKNYTFYLDKELTIKINSETSEIKLPPPPPPPEKPCSRCKGTGNCYSCNGVGGNLCNYCNGRGQTWSSGYGTSGYTTCTYCRGIGKQNCRVCNGTGKCQQCKGVGYF